MEQIFKDFKAELKKVIWPTPKQVLNNTTAVIVIVLLTAAIVFVLDLAFETLNTHGVDKLKSVVSKEENVLNENTLEENVVDNTTDSNTTDTTEENTVSLLCCSRQGKRRKIRSFIFQPTRFL